MDEIDLMREKMKAKYKTSSRPPIIRSFAFGESRNCFASQNKYWDKLAKKASLLLVVVGTMFFMVGVHNVDNAWNIRTIEIDTGRVYLDTTLLGSQHEASDIYNMGILYEFMGFIITAGALIEINAQNARLAVGKAIPFISAIPQ